jgi:hypothetical protein
VFCESRLRIITGGGGFLGFLHPLVGNFKNESRFGLFLSHKHVALCRNFPSGANVHCPLVGLDEGLRNPNCTAFRVWDLGFSEGPRNPNSMYTHTRGSGNFK